MSDIVQFSLTKKTNETILNDEKSFVKLLFEIEHLLMFSKLYMMSYMLLETQFYGSLEKLYVHQSLISLYALIIYKIRAQQVEHIRPSAEAEYHKQQVLMMINK